MNLGLQPNSHSHRKQSTPGHRVKKKADERREGLAVNRLLRNDNTKKGKGIWKGKETVVALFM